MKKIKNKKRITFALLLAIVFSFGCFTSFVPCKRVSAGGEDLEVVDVSNFSEYSEDWISDENAWMDDAINLADYKEYLKTENSNKEAIVVVIDSGISTISPLFKDRIATIKEDITFEAGYYNSKNVYTSLYKKDYKQGDYLGYVSEGRETTVHYENYKDVNPNIPDDYEYCPLEDDSGHGTSVSSVIASLTPTNVKIAPIKLKNLTNGDIVEPNDLFTTSFLLIEEWIKAGYNIVAVNISLSLSSADYDYDCTVAGKQTSTETIHKRIKHLREEYNVLTTVSAGNDYVDGDTRPTNSCEEAITCSGVMQQDDGYILFTGMNSKGELKGSNYGTCVDITAPGYAVKLLDIKASDKEDKDGDGVYNECVDERYITFEETKYSGGTSYSAPCVAAAVALLSIDSCYYDENGNRTYTADELAERLLNCVSTDKLIEMDKENPYGNGMLDLSKHKRQVKHNVSNLNVTYDGDVHLLNITTETDCEIMYGLTEGEYNLTEQDLEESDILKTAKAKFPLYYKITATGEQGRNFKETTGVVYVSIAKRKVVVKINDAKFDVNTSINLDSVGYEIVSGEIYGGEDLNIKLLTDANINKLGKYKVWGQASNQNYDVEFVEGELRVKLSDATVNLIIICASVGAVLILVATIFISGKVRKSRRRHAKRARNSLKF